jgi:hypothetical protein
MVSEVKKSWFRRHWIITTFLIIILIGMISSMFNSNDDSTKKSSSLTLGEPTYPQPSNIKGEDEDKSLTGNAVNNNPMDNSKSIQQEGIDLYELEYLFCRYDSPYTDLQKEEEFKKYKDKWIETSVIVDEVHEGWLGGLYVTALAPDVTIHFKESEKDKLLKIDKYDEINFSGRIDRYSLFGISIEDAELR